MGHMIDIIHTLFLKLIQWADSSVGRALPLQGRGRRFKPCSAYHFRAIDKYREPTASWLSEFLDIFPRDGWVNRLELRAAFIVCGAVVQLVRTPDCQSGGRGFKSRRPRHTLLNLVFPNPLSKTIDFFSFPYTHNRRL